MVYRVGEGSTMREEIMIHHEVLNSLLEKGYVTNAFVSLLYQMKLMRNLIK